MFINFFIKSELFDDIWLVTFFLYMVTTIFVLIKQSLISSKNKNKFNTDYQPVLSFIFWLIIIIGLCITFNILLQTLSIILILLILSAIPKVKNIIKKNVSNLVFKDIFNHTFINILYILTSFCIRDFNLDNINELTQYLLIFCLLLKLSFFTFILITDVSIIFSNIISLFSKKMLQKLKCFIERITEIDPANLILYIRCPMFKSQRKIIRTLGDIVYLIIYPLYVSANLIFPFFASVLIFLSKKLLNISKIVSGYIKISSDINLIAFRISLIVSFIFIYISVLYHGNILIKQEAIEIYSLIITVILIPLIYDSIKNRKEHQK